MVLSGAFRKSCHFHEDRDPDFIGYLGCGALRQVGDLRVQEAKQKLYHKLAFQDILTGLKNRTAFEKKMNEIRTEEKEWKTEHPKGNWVVLVTDMNGLKKINDGLGHTKGDEAIIRTGFLLMENFEGIGNCYRIGGDEFCVLSKVERMEDFEEACSEFRAAVRKADEQTEYQYAVSVGYCVVDESGIDECLKRQTGSCMRKRAGAKSRRRMPSSFQVLLYKCEQTFEKRIAFHRKVCYDKNKQMFERGAPVESNF